MSIEQVADGQIEKQSPTADRFYFPGLNQLRMLAAFAVVVHHIEQFKNLFGFTYNIWNCFPILAAGWEGVRLFFVLSGFLITFLAIQELNKTGKIEVKKFYLRRLLRIWPLYYLVTINAFFLSPLLFHFPPGSGIAQWFEQLHHHFWSKLGLFIFFLPNLCLIKFTPIIMAAQCWSLGVEEQFYLIWPWVLLQFRKMLPIGILSAVLFKETIVYVMDRLLHHWSFHFDSNIYRQLDAIYQMIVRFEVESFAAGAIAAWLMVRYPEQLRKISLHPISSLCILASIILCHSFDFPYRSQLIIVAFTFFVLSLAHRQINLGFLNKLVDHLGCISYGLYMLHTIVIVFVLQWLIATPLAKNSLEANITIYGLTFVLSSVLASLSYAYFEKPFLKLKTKLAVIRTTSV